MLKEHSNNHYIKEKDEVEKYLLRIIQRYFDIEHNYTKESIEAMILESLTRFKQMVISEKGFIFSLNKQTGHLTLTMRDIGGEQLIKRNTAFNKNFGTETDTICEGNDSRLSNERKPLSHTHNIADIGVLKDTLEKIGITNPSLLHAHKNIDILDMLKYSGEQAQIDLVVIDFLQQSLSNYETNLQALNKELVLLQDKNMDNLSLYVTQIQQDITNFKDLCKASINWLDDVYKYAQDNINKYEISTLHSLTRYVNKEHMKTLNNFLKKIYDRVGSGEIPITDGNILLSHVKGQSIEISTSNEVKEFYNEATILNNINSQWLWNNIKETFVFRNIFADGYTLNPMLLSTDKYDTYTHRVTLTSSSTTKNYISLVLAYNDETGDHLTLLINNGGLSSMSAATASISLNYDGDYYVPGRLKYAEIGIGKSWSLMNYGVTVLVKRSENNFKIWVSYDEEHSWNPEIKNNVKDIYPSEDPTIEFSITDFPELQMFANRKCNYGYSSYGQDMSAYEDIYFTGISERTSGHTNIIEMNTIQSAIPANIFNGSNNHRIKLFFRYNKDGQTVTTPLPFSFKDEHGNQMVIQGAFSETGDVIITTHYITKINSYNTELYDSDTIIIVYDKLNTLLEHKERLSMENYKLALIDSTAKNNFVKKLLASGIEYYIEGYCFVPDGLTYYQEDGVTQIQYTDWDTKEPNVSGVTSHIKYNTNKKWAHADAIVEKIGCIAEYKINKLSQCYENPRIYYQVLGNKEGL